MAENKEDQSDVEKKDLPHEEDSGKKQEKDENEEPEDLGELQSNKWNPKRKALYVGLSIFLLVIFFFIAVWFFPEVAIEKKRVKIGSTSNQLSGKKSKTAKNNQEVVKSTNHEMAPFFISLNEGEDFVRLNIKFVNIDIKLREKMINNPYIYRDAILSVFEFKSASDIKAKGASEQLKKEVLSALVRVTGNSIAGEVEFDEFGVI